MRNNLVYSLMLILPLTVYTACSDDEPDDGNTGGASSSAGRGGAGGRAGAGNGGKAGDTDTGDAGSGGSPGGGTNAGLAGAAGSPEAAGAAGAGEAGAGAAGEGGAGGMAATLSDAQVLRVLATANQGEVAVGQLALAGAAVPSVKTFAQTMVTEHSAANVQVLGLVASKHLAPEASPVSEMLDREATEMLAALSQTPTAMFDRAYMEGQVTMHQEVLALLDDQLIPSASDADLKALLATLRMAVATHLVNAQTILEAL